MDEAARCLHSFCVGSRLIGPQICRLRRSGGTKEIASEQKRARAELRAAQAAGGAELEQRLACISRDAEERIAQWRATPHDPFSQRSQKRPREGPRLHQLSPNHPTSLPQLAAKGRIWRRFRRGRRWDMLQLAASSHEIHP